jgi:hypothetical protein
VAEQPRAGPAGEGRRRVVVVGHPPKSTEEGKLFLEHVRRDTVVRFLEREKGAAPVRSGPLAKGFGSSSDAFSPKDGPGFTFPVLGDFVSLSLDPAPGAVEDADDEAVHWGQVDVRFVETARAGVPRAASEAEALKRRVSVYHAVLFLTQHDDRRPPPLERGIVKEAKRLVAAALEAAGLVDRVVEEFALPYADPRMHTLHARLGIPLPKGILLWGPPGTGKTSIVKLLCDLLGVHSVCEPLSASQLTSNRSKVGETEQLLKDLAFRAKLTPWLVCGLAIDEIDVMAPSRMQEDTSQFKLDTLSQLLSVFGGVQDQPNLVMLGSTNRKWAIDEAFLRRIEKHFFVGRMTPDARRKYIVKTKLLQAGLIDHAVLLSTNFTGANLQQFTSQLLLQAAKRSTSDEPEATKEQLEEAYRLTAQRFQLSFGGCDLVALLGQPNPLQAKWPPAQVEVSLTGRVFADARTDGPMVEFETRGGSGGVVRVAWPQGGGAPVDNLLGWAVTAAVRSGYDSVQFITATTLYAQGVYEETGAMKVINGTFQEMAEYSKSLLIFELDALVQVMKEESTSSSGPSGGSTSQSFRVQQPHLLRFILSRAIEAASPKHSVVLVSSNKVLIDIFKSYSRGWPLNPAEKEEAELERELTRPIECDACGETYNRASNRNSACKAHPGSVRRDKKDGQIVNPPPVTDQSGVFFWDCCGARFTAPHLHANGCVPKPHTSKDAGPPRPTAASPKKK